VKNTHLLAAFNLFIKNIIPVLTGSSPVKNNDNRSAAGIQSQELQNVGQKKAAYNKRFGRL